MKTTETRPGYKTTEFWLVILSNVLINVGAIDVGDSKIRGLVLLASIIGYALSRGLAKTAVPADYVVALPINDPADVDRHA